MFVRLLSYLRGYVRNHPNTAFDKKMHTYVNVMSNQSRGLGLYKKIQWLVKPNDAMVDVG